MATDESLRLAIPVGLPPVGEDPETFYAELESRIDAQTSTTSVVSIWTDPDDRYSGIYAMVKAAARYIPVGAPGIDGTTPVTSPTLLCQTWVWDYLALQSASGGSGVPSLAVAIYSNLDEAAVRADITTELTTNPEYADLTTDERARAVDEFMGGDSILLVNAGIRLGRGAQDATHPSAYRKVELALYDAEGSVLVSAFQFSVFATVGGPNVDGHPLLAALQGPVTPAVAPIEGRTRTRFTGTGLNDSSSITFGGNAATHVRATSDGSALYATVPAGTAGTVDVVVDGTTYPASFAYTEDVLATSKAALSSLKVYLEDIALSAKELLDGGSLDEEARYRLLSEMDIATGIAGEAIDVRAYNSGADVIDPNAFDVFSSAAAEIDELVVEACVLLGWPEGGS